MSDMHTPRLALPLLQPGQAQKEMTVNEAVARLDIAVQGAVIAAAIDAPPANPDPGDCWIVGSAPGGDWAGHAHEIAGWTHSGWLFVRPREGTQLWIGSTGSFALFTGVRGGWASSMENYLSRETKWLAQGALPSRNRREDRRLMRRLGQR
ncbi:DUF2793 domain-containing protein [Sphingomonas sp. 7/4-4]|uniref:DUF2793 domain-containing protein n=1 Tax=Sphingomonas sp. 7/4-4 TaxID=3018446 RepID=UPI0022F3FAA5|nr:DUF2793 domain-containing protein [Sphingomonas sp. 7/4-4]WBY07101.1 DUF2793 domain-containing protein [Sphingomonas sp. 7/4-4]